MRLPADNEMGLTGGVKLAVKAGGSSQSFEEGIKARGWGGLKRDQDCNFSDTNESLTFNGGNA